MADGDLLFRIREEGIVCIGEYYQPSRQHIGRKYNIAKMGGYGKTNIKSANAATLLTSLV
jgi:hypothetical protein